MCCRRWARSVERPVSDGTASCGVPAEAAARMSWSDAETEVPRQLKLVRARQNWVRCVDRAGESRCRVESEVDEVRLEVEVQAQVALIWRGCMQSTSAPLILSLA